MHDRAENNNGRDKFKDNELNEKFTLEFTKEEGLLLLTSARLLDKLVAGVTIHAQERDELIKEIIGKLSAMVSIEVSHLSNELADAIVDSVLGEGEMEDDYSYVSDALALNMQDTDSFLDSYNEEDLQALRRSITEDDHNMMDDINIDYDKLPLDFPKMDSQGAQKDHFARSLELDAAHYAQIEFPMYATDKTLPVLEKAMINHLSVRVQYYSFLRESVDTVTLNPLIMIKEQGNWRMVAYCHERSEMLLFRVDRIKEMVETADTFEAPNNVGQISYKRLPVYS